jgi:hypothetical protein
MKKFFVLLFFINQLQANEIQNIEKRVVLTWRPTLTAMVDAAALYLGLYGSDEKDKSNEPVTLVFLLRDAGLLGECTKECASILKNELAFTNIPPIKLLAISRDSVDSENFESYLSAQIKQGLPRDKSKWVLVDTGYDGSLMRSHFCTSTFHFLLSRTEKIPMTFQYLVHLNPEVVYTGSQRSQTPLHLVQDLENTFPVPTSSIVGYSPTPPYQPLYKQGPFELKDSYIFPELYEHYLADLKSHLSENLNLQKRLRRRFKIWREFRKNIEMRNKKNIEAQIRLRCTSEDPFEIAIGRDMLEVLRYGQFRDIFPEFDETWLKKIKPSFPNKNFSSQGSIQDQSYFEIYLKEFFQEPNPLKRLLLGKSKAISKESDTRTIKDGILQYLERNPKDGYQDLFRLYLAIPRVLQEPNKKTFYQAIGSAVGQLIAQGDREAEGLYQLLLTQQNVLNDEPTSEIFSSIFQALKDSSSWEKLNALISDLNVHAKQFKEIELLVTQLKKSNSI